MTWSGASQTAAHLADSGGGDRPRIVVGFDGSAGGVLALNWALDEADLRGGLVVLCHVERPQRSSGDGEDPVRVTAERILAQGIDHARRQAPGLEVTSEPLFGNPARKLIETAANAALLVIGARGKDGFQGLRLGSVSAQVARHAKCSVVVVPARGNGDRGRRIVVGVDGSTGSDTALAFAFDEAARNHAELCAVHAFDAASMQIMANLPQTELQRLHVLASDTLGELLARHADGYPGVRAYGEVLAGAPASALVSAAADAEMLVLGARGHGDIATLLLGSTSQTVLHNATCPVAVVRDNR